MKLMLMWSRGGPALAEICAALGRAGHEIVYVVSSDDSERFAPKKAVYHDHYDAWDGKRAAALAGDRIPPVSRAEIALRYRLESLIMTMMNKRYDVAPVGQRKHQYHDMLAYWKYVFDRFQPDGVIFQIVPHSVYNYIAFELARERGLFTFMFEEAVVGDRLLAYRDFWFGSDELRQRLAQYKKQGVRLRDLDEGIQDYLRKFERSSSGQDPWYLRDIKRNSAGIGLWKIRAKAFARSVLDGSLPRLAASFIRRKWQAELPREYRSVVRPFDKSKPYVYLPLQFQPERTTSPHGDVYHDQLLVAETLSAALPPGWEIVTKEHPSQWLLRNKTHYNSVRWMGFYEHLARIPGVRVVPIGTDSFELIDSSRAVAVVTGTAGLEALIRHKTPLVFGVAWYRDCPGVRTVGSAEDCRTALASLNEKTREEDVFAFLKAYEDVSMRTHFGQPTDALQPISDEEGTRLMTNRIIQELETVRKEKHR